MLCGQLLMVTVGCEQPLGSVEDVEDFQRELHCSHKAELLSLLLMHG